MNCLCCLLPTVHACRGCHIPLCPDCGIDGLCGLCERMRLYREESIRISRYYATLPPALVLTADIMPWAGCVVLEKTNERTEEIRRR